MKNRILSTLLTLCLLLTLLPASALAVDDPVTLDISEGSIVIDADGYTIGSQPKETYAGDYVITGTSNNENSLTILSQAAWSTITLKALSITSSDYAPLSIANATFVSLEIADAVSLIFRSTDNGMSPNAISNGATNLALEVSGSLYLESNKAAALSAAGTVTLTGSGSFTAAAAGNHAVITGNTFDASGFKGSITFYSSATDVSVLTAATAKLAGKSVTFAKNADGDQLEARASSCNTLEITTDETLSVASTFSGSIISNGQVTLESEKSISLCASGSSGAIFAGRSISLNAADDITLSAPNNTSTNVISAGSCELDAPTVTILGDNGGSESFALLSAGTATSDAYTIYLVGTRNAPSTAIVGTNGRTPNIIVARNGGNISSKGLVYDSTLPSKAVYYQAGEGTVLYTPADDLYPATLTLNNATILCTRENDVLYDGAGIYSNSQAAMNLELIGDNHVTGAPTAGMPSSGMLFMGAATIGGDDNSSLTAIAGAAGSNRSGIHTGGKLTVTGGTVIGEGSCGIWAKDLSVSGSASLTGIGNPVGTDEAQYGISCSALQVTSDATVLGKTEPSENQSIPRFSVGILAQNGIQTEGALTGTSAAASTRSAGIESDNNCILSAGTMVATGVGGGVYMTAGGKLIMDGGTLIATGTGDGSYGVELSVGEISSEFSLNDGTATLSGGKSAMNRAPNLSENPFAYVQGGTDAENLSEVSSLNNANVGNYPYLSITKAYKSPIYRRDAMDRLAGVSVYYQGDPGLNLAVKGSFISSGNREMSELGEQGIYSADIYFRSLMVDPFLPPIPADTSKPGIYTYDIAKLNEADEQIDLLGDPLNPYKVNANQAVFVLNPVVVNNDVTIYVANENYEVYYAPVGTKSIQAPTVDQDLLDYRVNLGISSEIYCTKADVTPDDTVTGLYSAKLTNVPGQYIYFLADKTTGEIVLDPYSLIMTNTIAGDGWSIEGFDMGAELKVTKGKSLTLPETATLYSRTNWDGEEVSVSYELNGTFNDVSLTEGVLTVGSGCTDSVIYLKAINGNVSSIIGVAVETPATPSNPGSGGSSPSTTTETTQNPDGSTTTTVTNKTTGTVTETTKRPDGSTVVTETKKDGSVATTEKAANGVTTVTKTDASGNTAANVTVPSSVQNKVIVSIPADLGNTDGTVSATVTYPNGKKETVTISYSGGKLTVPVSGSATIEILDDFVPLAAMPFTDVAQSAYYYDAVQWAVASGVTSGTTATIFAPNATCTRAQAVTLLWRAMGSPKPTTTSNPFTDVSEDAYYYKAVLWAVEQGVTSGTTPTSFSPNAVCSRAQVVTFLWRAEGKPAVNDPMSFADVPADAYYTEAVRWAVSQGITSGTGATAFSPANSCTRAQIVTFLYLCFG